jgi:hypothetical protein
MVDAPDATSQREPRLGDYAAVSAVLTAFCLALVAAVQAGSGAPAQPQALIPPMLGMFALTALVWLLMVVARNASIMLGRASVRYYVAYTSHTPSEKIERPARVFNNLMQVPTLFYVVCVLGLVTRHVDGAQITLAWIYVAARCLHAIVYIGWNRVQWRFACWAASCVVLGVSWVRFALLNAG